MPDKEYQPRVRRPRRVVKRVIRNGNYEFKFPLESDGELFTFVDAAFGVRFPNVQVCPNHSTPWRAFCDAYFARSPVIVCKASRGFGGKSFWLATLAATKAITQGADVNILGGSGEQSRNVLEALQQLWHAPNAPRSVMGGEVVRETRLRNGARIRALLASQTSVRGSHPQILLLDEIDEMTLPILDASLGQPMSKKGVLAQTVMSSTHQYADGTMTTVLRRAAEQGHITREWCYKETAEPHGWLTNEMIERTRATMPAQMWKVEVELQEPSFEARAIDPDAVGKMFDRSLGDFIGSNGEYIEIEEPDLSGEYAHGTDWARKIDWTVITTLRIDTRPMRLVAFERTGRKPWPQMLQRFEKRIQRFGGPASHDGTGLGDVVHSMLESETEAFIMTGRKKNDLLAEYVTACEGGEIVSPFIAFAEKEHRYASTDDIYGAGHPPDSMVSGALAYRASKRRRQIVTAIPAIVGDHRVLRIG